MKPSPAQLTSFIQAARTTGKSDAEIAAYIASQGIVPPPELLRPSASPVTPSGSFLDTASNTVANGLNHVQSVLDRLGAKQLGQATGAATGALGEVVGSGVGLLLGKSQPMGPGVTDSADSTSMAETNPVLRATASQTASGAQQMGQQAGQSAPMMALMPYLGGVGRTAVGASQAYQAWKTVKGEYDKTDPSLSPAARLGTAITNNPEAVTSATLNGALAGINIPGGIDQALSGDATPHPVQFLKDIGRVAGYVLGSIPGLKGPITNAVLGKQTATALKNPRQAITQTQQPTGTDSAYSNLDGEANYAALEAATKAHLEDIRVPSADGVVADRIGRAFDVSAQLQKELGSQLGDAIAQYGDTKVPGFQNVRANFQNDLANRFGLTVDESTGTLVPASEAKPMELTDSESKTLLKAWDQISSLGDSPTAQDVKTTVKILDKSVKFASKSLESPIDTPVSGLIKSYSGAINDQLYKTLPPEYQQLNQSFSQVKQLNDEVNAALGPNEKKGVAFVQKLMSRAAQPDTIRIMDGLKAVTGYDAVKDALVAKSVLENSGDPRAYSLLELQNAQAAGKSGGISGAVINFGKKLYQKSIGQSIKSGVGAAATESQSTLPVPPQNPGFPNIKFK